MVEQRILVVEDHRPLLMAIRDILKREGYIVLTASDGVEALQVMEETCPDLIVADIMMPRMDGYAFYEAVRKHPRWVLIPFIFLTAKAEQKDVIRGKGLGAEDYITKPFDPQELVVAVQARLGRAREIRAATAVELEDLKQQIVTVLGHELRTPLTYVLGYTELALEDVTTLSPDALENFLRGIRKGADRLARLVNDLILLVRLDTGQAVEEYRMLGSVRTNLYAVVRRSVRQCQPRAAAAGVTLTLEELSESLPPIRFHEFFFVDSLTRLIDNGIKFSCGEEKQVTVQVSSVEGWVEVAVSDQGVGIPAEEMRRLFERFQQIGREKMEQQGTGLGLAIAQELIRMHGGEITVQSKVGEGSTFTIRLPVASGAPAG